MRSLIDRFYLIFVICASGTVFGAVFGGSASLQAGGSESAFSGGDSNPVLLALNLAVGLATLVLCFAKFPKIFAMLWSLKPLLLLYLLAACSLLWSADRLSTFRSVVYLFIYLLAASYIAIRFDGEVLIHYLCVVIVILALLSIPAQYILPHSQFEEGHWRGVFLQKNELGSAMMIGIAMLLAEKKRWGILRVGSILLCSILLVLSNAVTAVICTVVGVMVHFYLNLNRRLRPILIALIVVAGIAVLASGENLTDLFSDTTGRNLTLTGRTDVWAIVIEKIMARPLLGYGYGAFWTTEGEAVQQYVGTWAPHHAHDGYLNVCLDLGVVGISLILVVILAGWWRGNWLWRVHGSKLGRWMLVLTIILVIHEIAEVDLLQARIAWFVYLVSYLSCRWEELILADVVEPNLNHVEGRYHIVEGLVAYRFDSVLGPATFRVHS